MNKKRLMEHLEKLNTLKVVTDLHYNVTKYSAVINSLGNSHETGGALELCHFQLLGEIFRIGILKKLSSKMSLQNFWGVTD